VVVEPHVKGTFSGENKRWPWEYWQEVVTELRDQGKRVVQISAPGTDTLLDVDFRVSESQVRVALACLAWAQPLITTDGLLHHAAAAMGVPATVIWGSRTDPRILGYPDHVNLSAGPPYCGMRTECEHCHKAMREIVPAAVLDGVLT
jgi:ADP-heptose:LPS heptosyltransferase